MSAMKEGLVLGLPPFRRILILKMKCRRSLVLVEFEANLYCSFNEDEFID